jgi:hypothetical protein
MHWLASLLAVTQHFTEFGVTGLVEWLASQGSPYRNLSVPNPYNMAVGTNS